MANRAVPEITGSLRKHIIRVPDVIRREASGISIMGKTIYSMLFTTDIAIIRNCNADAIIAVYPFTPHPAVTQAIMSAADMPVLCGVGGGTTQGLRSVNVALHAEFQGALAVVLNAPVPERLISDVKETVDIPVVLTVVSELTDISGKLAAGADILNVSGGANTARIVRTIRAGYPKLPIIATGGPTEETIRETIESGANAITYTPPSNGELFKVMMEKYRLDEIERAGRLKEGEHGRH
ncbi:MAG: hydrolase [Clostridiales bacterium]|nr:hydrolase [Clostridiales bacterium]